MKSLSPTFVASAVLATVLGVGGCSEADSQEDLQLPDGGVASAESKEDAKKRGWLKLEPLPGNPPKASGADHAGAGGAGQEHSEGGVPESDAPSLD